MNKDRRYKLREWITLVAQQTYLLLSRLLEANQGGKGCQEKEMEIKRKN